MRAEEKPGGGAGWAIPTAERPPSLTRPPEAASMWGNWPGSRWERREGSIKNSFLRLMDLPGIYSLSPYSLEEKIARDYILDGQPDLILNIVDGTNIQRNLYLSLQLLELGMPTVIAVNMMDDVRAKGSNPRATFSPQAGVPVTPHLCPAGESTGAPANPGGACAVGNSSGPRREIRYKPPDRKALGS